MQLAFIPDQHDNHYLHNLQGNIEIMTCLSFETYFRGVFFKEPQFLFRDFIKIAEMQAFSTTQSESLISGEALGILTFRILQI